MNVLKEYVDAHIVQTISGTKKGKKAVFSGDLNKLPFGDNPDVSRAILEIIQDTTFIRERTLQFTTKKEAVEFMAANAMKTATVQSIGSKKWQIKDSGEPYTEHKITLGGGRVWSTLEFLLKANKTINGIPKEEFTIKKNFKGKEVQAARNIFGQVSQGRYEQALRKYLKESLGIARGEKIKDLELQRKFIGNDPAKESELEQIKSELKDLYTVPPMSTEQLQHFIDSKNTLATSIKSANVNNKNNDGFNQRFITAYRNRNDSARDEQVFQSIVKEIESQLVENFEGIQQSQVKVKYKVAKAKKKEDKSAEGAIKSFLTLGKKEGYTTVISDTSNVVKIYTGNSKSLANIKADKKSAWDTYLRKVLPKVSFGKMYLSDVEHSVSLFKTKEAAEEWRFGASQKDFTVLTEVSLDVKGTAEKYYVWTDASAKQFLFTGQGVSTPSKAMAAPQIDTVLHEYLHLATVKTMQFFYQRLSYIDTQRAQEEFSEMFPKGSYSDSLNFFRSITTLAKIYKDKGGTLEYTHTPDGVLALNFAAELNKDTTKIPEALEFIANFGNGKDFYSKAMSVKLSSKEVESAFPGENFSQKGRSLLDALIDTILKFVGIRKESNVYEAGQRALYEYLSSLEGLKTVENTAELEAEFTKIFEQFEQNLSEEDKICI